MSELSTAPLRSATNRAMAATLRIWQAGDRARVDWPAACWTDDALRGFAHAHQVMAVHIAHRCPRFQMAADYASEAC